MSKLVIETIERQKYAKDWEDVVKTRTLYNFKDSRALRALKSLYKPYINIFYEFNNEKKNHEKRWKLKQNYWHIVNHEKFQRE